MDLALQKGNEVTLKILNRFDEYIQGRVLSAGKKEIRVILANTEEKILFSATSFISLNRGETYRIICLTPDFEQYRAAEKDRIFLKLLEPITWSYTTSLNYRKNLVNARRDEVRKIYPFLNEKEKQIAKEWLAKEQHLALWD